MIAVTLDWETLVDIRVALRCKIEEWRGFALSSPDAECAQLILRRYERAYERFNNAHDESVQRDFSADALAPALLRRQAG